MPAEPINETETKRGCKPLKTLAVELSPDPGHDRHRSGGRKGEVVMMKSGQRKKVTLTRQPGVERAGALADLADLADLARLGLASRARLPRLVRLARRH